MEITYETRMREILDSYPEAKVGLFQRYHIGGCNACSYDLDETLGQVKEKHNIKAELDEIVATIRESGRVEQALHVSVAELQKELDSGVPLKLLDARQAAEYAEGHIPGSQLIDVNLQFEILDEWPKNERIVIVSNDGERSLKRASHFRAYGMHNVVSLDGGIKAWRDAGGVMESV